MSGNRARIRHRARHNIVKGNKSEKKNKPIRIEIKNGDAHSGHPIATAMLTDDWIIIPLQDRVVSIRRAN